MEYLDKYEKRFWASAYLKNIPVMDNVWHVYMQNENKTFRAMN